MKYKPEQLADLIYQDEVENVVFVSRSHFVWGEREGYSLPSLCACLSFPMAHSGESVAGTRKSGLHSASTFHR